MHRYGENNVVVLVSLSTYHVFYSPINQRCYTYDIPLFRISGLPADQLPRYSVPPVYKQSYYEQYILYNISQYIKE